MRYWQYLRDGKEMTNTRSFLYTIANNLAKDWYKKKKSVSLDGVLDEGGPAGLLADKKVVLSPEISASYQEALAMIDDMDENDKQVLLLTHVEGLTPADIASAIGETANTVSVRLNRAITRLQQRLHTYEKRQ